MLLKIYVLNYQVFEYVNYFIMRNWTLCLPYCADTLSDSTRISNRYPLMAPPLSAAIALNLSFGVLISTIVPNGIIVGSTATILNSLKYIVFVH